MQSSRNMYVGAGDNATSVELAINWFFRLLALAVIYSFFQHLFSGLRHLVLDMGAGYELKTQPDMGACCIRSGHFCNCIGRAGRGITRYRSLKHG